MTHRALPGLRLRRTVGVVGKWLAAVAIVLMSSLMAPAALAQAKDPFQPATGVSSSGGVVAPQPAPGGPTAQPAPPPAGPGLVRTGADVELQVQAAVLLLVLGAAMLITVRALGVLTAKPTQPRYA